MVDTYHWHKQGYAVPYDAFGHVLLRKKLDVPAIIASGAAGNSPLAISDARTALPSTGFASGDILQLWRLPAGVILLGGGLRVTTLGGATNIDVGHASSNTHKGSAAVDRWLDAAVTTATGYFNFDEALGTVWAASNGVCPTQTLTIGNMSVDITFNSAAEKLLIANFWMWGHKVY